MYQSRRGFLRSVGLLFSVSLSGCIGSFGTDSSHPKENSSIPIFVYNEDETSHAILVQVDGTVAEETFSKSTTVQSEAIDKVGEVEVSEFYLKANVESLENGMDATGPAPGESDYSRDGYLILIRDESEVQSRVEIKPLNPVGDATTESE